MPPRKTRIVLFKLHSFILKTRLDHTRVVIPNFGHVRSQQRAFSFAIEQRDATHVPLKLAALDSRATESTGADRVLLKRRSAAWTMKRCCLRWRWRQQIALALEFPTFANVIGRFRRRTAFYGHNLSVVCLKH